MKKYYVLATHITSGKVVVFQPKDTIEECHEDIKKYDAMDNKNEKRYEYTILIPIEQQHE